MERGKHFFLCVSHEVIFKEIKCKQNTKKKIDYNVKNNEEVAFKYIIIYSKTSANKL